MRGLSYIIHMGSKCNHRVLREAEEHFTQIEEEEAM
jgi:hypothetical protein